MQQKRTPRDAGVRPQAHVLNGLVGIALTALVCRQLSVPGLAQASRVIPVILAVAGYLCTIVIVRTHDRQEGLGIGELARLWWQHLRYIWPSLFCVVSFTCALCAVLNAPLLSAMVPDTLPTLGLYENWSALVRNVSPTTSASPLADMWFLSVEVQLFLAWSLILAALLRAGKTIARRSTLALFFVSVVWLILQCVLGGNLMRVTLATDARACAFLLGSWLGLAFPLGRVPVVGKDLLIRPMGPRNRHLRGRRYQATPFANVLGFLAFVAIIVIVGFVPASGTLTQGITDVAVSVSAVLLMASLIAPGNILGRVFSLPPLKYLGSRALGIFLWTRPHYQLATTAYGTVPWYLRLGVAIATLAAAEITYRLVELPFASAEVVGDTKRDIAPYRLATTTLVVAIATAFGAHALLNIPNSPSESSHANEASESASSPSPTTQTQSQITSDTRTNGKDSSGTADTTTNASDEESEADDELAEDTQKDTARVTIDDDTVIYAPASETRAGKFDPVLIGDSVPGDADWSRLPDALIDTYIGRRPDQALEVIRGYLDQDAVGSIVILACFSNTTATPEQLDEFVELLGDERQIYVIGTVNPDGFMDVANENLQAACKRHDNMHYIDWPAVEDGHQDEYLWADATHLRPEGGVAYVNMVVNAIAQDLIDAGGTTE